MNLLLMDDFITSCTDDLENVSLLDYDNFPNDEIVYFIILKNHIC